MKFNFKKISAIGASVLMTGMTMGVAAAASFPAPFVTGSGADVAVVYGANADLDYAQTTNIVEALQKEMPKSGSTTAPTGDSVLIAKSSDNLNIGDTWGVLTGTIDDDELPELLEKGTYTADDNDDFKFEQKITLGSPTLQHFRDSDYESEVGLDTKTPALGFKLSSSTFVMNYTYDFVQQAESDITSGDLEDIEGSDIMLLGKNYYVSDLKNGSSSTYLGKLTLLDSATTGLVAEGEVTTLTVDGTPYEVSLNFVSSSSAKLTVNGETTNSLSAGQSFKLKDGTFLGVKEITKLEVAGETGTVEFSLGSGKLEITSGSDVKLNDVSVNGVKGYVHRGTGSSGTEKIDKIVIEWITDEEMFLTPMSELTMPGFGGMKFTMNELMRPDEEKITLQNDGDTSIEMSVPIKDGTVSLNLVYSSSTTGNLTGIGKATDERLATSAAGNVNFFEKSSGNDYHSYFVASYATTTEAESYVLRALVSTDTDIGRNETTIQKLTEDDGWINVCEDRVADDSCDVGDVSLTITEVNYTSGGDENVLITGGTNVNFSTMYTAGGLMLYLPFEGLNGSSQNGQINFTTTDAVAGHDPSSFYLFMDGEDKDDTLAAGTEFNFTINENTDKNLQVQQVNNAGTGGGSGLEVGTSSNIYEAYIVDDIAPRIVHTTGGDEDYAEVYYPTGNSESYGEVYLTESGSVAGGVEQLGNIVVKDTEVSSVEDKNLIVVGGSCINTVAANFLGGAACGPSFTDKTEVASGQYIIKSVADAYTEGNIALIVAGYEAADTAAGVAYLTTQDVDTSKSYKGTSATTAEMITTEA